MVVDVATALMYGARIPCLPWGRIVLTFCWIEVLPAMEPLLGEWGASHCTVEASSLSCVSPLQGASTRFRVAICVEWWPLWVRPKLTPHKGATAKM